jgi:hypothetical protein
MSCCGWRNPNNRFRPAYQQASCAPRRPPEMQGSGCEGSCGCGGTCGGEKPACGVRPKASGAMRSASTARPFTRGPASQAMQTDVRYRGQSDWHEERAHSSAGPVFEPVTVPQRQRPIAAGYGRRPMSINEQLMSAGPYERSSGDPPGEHNPGISEARLQSILLDNDGDPQSMPTADTWNHQMTQDQRDQFIARVARNRRLSAADARRLAEQARTEDWNTVRSLVGSGLTFLTNWIHEENETRRQEIIANANAVAGRQTGQRTGEQSILDTMQTNANNANASTTSTTTKKSSDGATTLLGAAVVAKLLGIF